MAKKETRRQNYLSLKISLEKDRSSFDSHWRDLSDYLLPRRARFSTADTNRGEKKNTKIINSTGTQAIRTLRSGMMGGITSPARPWFRLTTSEPELAEVGPVKAWLHVVTQKISTIFLQSNLYNALPIVYGDIGTFAVSAIAIEEDFDKVIRCYVFPVGSYSVANDDKGNVRVFSRQFRLKVRQVVKRFATDEMGKIDWSILSNHVKSLYEEGNLDAWIDIHHIIHPNADYDPDGLMSSQKRYRSVYYEVGSNSEASQAYIPDDDKFLSDKGYSYFPILVPRWELTGEDEYGTNCPGMVALGDIRALQLMEKRKAQAIEKKVNPAMVASPDLKTAKSSILAGDITYIDESSGRVAFRPAHEVNLSLSELSADIEKHEFRIKRAFYEDLFLMLASLDRREITAREVEERHEEKLLALGPVLEQLNQDLLDPLIDITFEIALQQGMLPEAPPELQGKPLKVEYVSIMHQAQKAAGLAGLDRFMRTVGELSAIFPDVLDKVDADQVVDEYGETTGVSPRIIKSDEDVAAIRESKAQAQAAEQQMAMIQQGAGVAKDLSSAEVAGGNMLDAMIRQSQAGAPI